MKKAGKFTVVAILAAAVCGIVVYKSVQVRHQAAAFADDGVIGQGKPVLLELGSHSCVPCRQMMPILTELNNEQSGFVVSFVDVWAVSGKGQQYGIEAIPTQIFFDAAGKEQFRHVGFFPKEDILAKWKELGVSIH
ncbi:MAG: thioredoxin family protein [Planctomycetales bacterium]|nr:thioredoxin family protein [Planctomycetales bacterium]